MLLLWMNGILNLLFCSEEVISLDMHIVAVVGVFFPFSMRRCFPMLQFLLPLRSEPGSQHG